MVREIFRGRFFLSPKAAPATADDLGTVQIVMPENHIAMFNAPGPEGHLL